jgi:hypothetical protein
MGLWQHVVSICNISSQSQRASFGHWIEIYTLGLLSAHGIRPATGGSLEAVEGLLVVVELAKKFFNNVCCACI